MLYEMATGSRPFTGETPPSVLASIVRDPAPALTSVNPALPSELGRIVRRCLAKDPARRYQSVADTRNDLADLAQQPAHGDRLSAPHSRHRPWREALAWTLAAASLATSLVIVLGRTFEDPRPVDVVSLLPPVGATLTDGEAPVVSLDGRTVAFVATDASGRTLLYVRGRDALEARPLQGTDEATQPFWAPDGRSLGFFAGGQLKRVEVSGGRPLVLATAPVPRGGTWNPDDVIVFVPFPEDPPHRIAAGGGTAEPLGVRGERRWFPSFLPDGRRYLYLAPGEGIRLASPDSPETTAVIPSLASAAYVEPGVLMFRREEALVAQRVDRGSLQVQGTPVTIAENVGVNPITAQALFSASSDGALAYLGSGRGLQMAWFDRGGRRLSSVATLDRYNSLCLSADGRRLVHDATDTRTANVDLWSLDLTDGRRSRLTFEQPSDFYPTCAASGDDVVFASTRGRGTPNMYRLNTSAPGSEQPLPESTLPSLPTDWSRNGAVVLYSAYSRETNWDIWVLPLATGTPFAFVATGAEEKNAHMSPDGRWVAYTTRHADAEEVYVQPFPATRAKWQVSNGGGRQPQWAPDGRQLFYVSPKQRLLAVDVQTFVYGSSRVVVEAIWAGGIERTHQGNPYAVRADGERLLVADPIGEILPITLLVNWLAVLGSTR